MANKDLEKGRNQRVAHPLPAATDKQAMAEEKTVLLPAASSPPAPAAQQSRSASWLLAKQTPYALAMVIAALGWCMLHAVEAIEDSPCIEYVKTIKHRPDRTNFPQAPQIQQGHV